MHMELTTPAPIRDSTAARVTHRRDAMRVRAGTGRNVAARTFSLVLKVVPPSMRKDEDGAHDQQQRLAVADDPPAALESQDGASRVAPDSSGAGDSVGPGGAPGGSGGSVAQTTGTRRAPVVTAHPSRPAAPARQHTPRLSSREPRVNFTADLEEEEDVHATLDAIAGGGAKPREGPRSAGKRSLGFFAAANAVNMRRVSAAPDVIEIDVTPAGTRGVGAATPGSASDAASHGIIPLVPYASTPDADGVIAFSPDLGVAGDRLGAEAEATPPCAEGFSLAGTGAREVAVSPGFTPNGRPVLRVGTQDVRAAEAAAVAGRVNAVDPTPANTPWAGAEDVAHGDATPGGSADRGVSVLGTISPGLEGLAPGEPIDDDEEEEVAPGSAVTVMVNMDEELEEGGALRCSRRSGADEPPLVTIDAAQFGDDDNDFGGGVDFDDVDDADGFFGVGGDTPAPGMRTGLGGALVVDGGCDPMTGGLDAVGGKKRKRAAGPARPKGTPHKLERRRYERRKSLAAAGMRDDLEDEAGRPVRRSTRARSRPLEYWRGETKSYERSHQSLPTVKQVAIRTPNPNWPLTKTPHAGDEKKKRGGGAASRKAAEEARKRALALADVAHLSDDEETASESEGDEAGDFVSLAHHLRSAHKQPVEDACEDEE